MQSEHDHDHAKPADGGPEDDVRIADDEIADVVEDEGHEPMDDEDDFDAEMDAPGEGEDMEMDASEQLEDNSIGATCKYRRGGAACLKGARLSCPHRRRWYA